MTDPTTAILLNLITSTIWSTGSKGREWYEDRERQRAISENLGDLPTEFNRTLKSRVEKVAREQGNDELAMIAFLWDDEVAENLDSLDAYFGDEETAIREIADAIEAAGSTDLRQTDRCELEAIVAEASKETIKDFEERVEDADLDTRLNRELGKTIRENSTEALRRLERIEERIHWNNRQRYTLFDPQVEVEITNAVQRLVGPTQIEFVSRPEFEQIELGWSLILGPSGSGKTRLLGEVLQQTSEAVEHILIPDDTLLIPENVTFDPEQFKGDVMLVWDDLHEIVAEGDGLVVPTFIRELDAVLSEQGHQLYVFAAARSGSINELPGDIESKSGLWEDFDQEWLETPPEDILKEIATRLAKTTGVSISEQALDMLVTRTSGIGASAEPSYIKAAIETAGGRLEEEHIESLPETAKEIWAEQYRKLERNEIKDGRDIWLVLLSFKLLDETILPPIASIAEDIFRDVLDGGQDRLSFHRAVETLHEWQWIGIPEEAENIVGNFVYDIHPIQLKAVDKSLDPTLASGLSAYLLNSLNNRDIPWHWNRITVNGRFAVGLPFEEEFIPIKRKHFEDTIKLAEENDNEHCHILHNQYGQLLLTQEGPKVAAHHYALALQHEYDYPLGHNNYASSLQRRGYEKLAAKHYATALQQDYNSPTTHSNYAGLLKSRGDKELAAKHIAHSIRIAPYNPLTQRRYSRLQWDRGDRKHAAKHAALALQLSDENPHLHEWYARILKERGDTKLAAKHFALALQRADGSSILHQHTMDLLSESEVPKQPQDKYSMMIQPEINKSSIHIEYAILLGDRGDLRKAAQYLALALQMEYNSGRAHVNYALCLKERGYYQVSIKHLALALQFGYRTEQAHLEYGSLLRLRGDLREAFKHTAIALQSNYESPECHNRYADLLKARGDINLAKKHIALALQRQYMIVELHHKYAVLLAEQDYPRKAVEHFENAIRIGVINGRREVIQASMVNLIKLLNELKSKVDWIEDVDEPPEIPPIDESDQ